MDRRRPRARRRHGQPVVLRRRPRTAGDRGGGGGADRGDRGVLVLRAVHQRAGGTGDRAPRRDGAGRRRPRVPVLLGLGGRRLGDETGTRRPHAGRTTRAHADHQSRPRLSRGELRRHERPGHRPQPGRVGTARPRRRAGAGRRRRGAVGAHGRALRRGRRGHHRAGPGCRRRLSPGARLPRRVACAVRPSRRVPDLRRGHHRVRPPRGVVRRPPLRRRARPRDVRQGGDLGIPAAGGSLRRPARARAARGGRRLPVAHRLHVLRPCRGVRGGARQPRHHRGRGIARPSRADRSAPRRRSAGAGRRRGDRRRARRGGGVGCGAASAPGRRGGARPDARRRRGDACHRHRHELVLPAVGDHRRPGGPHRRHLGDGGGRT